MTTTELLRASVDKFVFTVPTDRVYSAEHCWIVRDGADLKVGLTDYRQQSIGDVAFVECKPVGTVVAAGDDLAGVETIKANIVVTSPVAGSVKAVNAALGDRPEVMNEDCYGEGWLVVLTPAETSDLDSLLTPTDYLALMVKEAEAAQAGR
jgi:glycine cleavage system H protein